MSTKDKDFEISRILPFEYTVNLFQNNELFFSKPSLWDDPYEKLNDYANDSHTRIIFAQCWCKTGYSDAMWRIFSGRKSLKNYGPGIQIRTYASDLRDAINDVKDTYDFSLYDDSVTYVKTSEYNDMLESQNRLGMAFVKRRAFRHELEYRYIITSKNSNKKLNYHENGIKIEIDQDLCNIIHRVFIDPFASPHLVKAVQQYFKGLEINCSQSSMYKEPIWDM